MQTIFLDYKGGPSPTTPRQMALQNLTIRFIVKDDLAVIQKVCLKKLIIIDFCEKCIFDKRCLTRDQYGQKRH